MERKSVFITGASAGIGFETARLFAREKWQVIATARRLNRLEPLKKEFPDIEILALDVKNIPQDLENKLDLSKIDVLVNNAGLALGTDPIQNAVEADWREMFETNIFGLISVTQLIIPYMLKKASGDIVNIGSVAAYQTYAGGSFYNATKFGVRALTEAWRKDLLGKGIRVIGIHPGMVETEFSEVRFRGDKSKAKDVYRGMSALKPTDIADAIYWSVTRPRHINIESLMIMPTDQAAVGMVHRDSSK